jgi:YVTN family beta-propeller protein
MHHLIKKTTIFSYVTAAALALFSVSAQATPPLPKNAPSTSTPTTETRWTFDGHIRNNTLAVSPDETMALAANSETPHILVYDLKTGKIKETLSGYITPRNIVFSPQGDVFYVSDSSLGVVFKIHSATLKTLGQFPAGPGAFGTTISANGKTLYINNQAASTVTVVDLNSNQPKTVLTGFSQPRQGIRLSPDNKKLYVTNFVGDKITIIDTSSQKTEGEITGFHKIRAISLTSDGKTLFAANSGTNNIAVVDTEKRIILKTIPVGKDPYGAALTPDGTAVYSGNLADNTLSVIALPEMKVTATVSGLQQPRQAIVFTKDSKTAYVLNGDLSVAVVDLKTNQVVRTLGREPILPPGT